MARVVKPRYGQPRGYRYTVFEADGSLVRGYVQKPAGLVYAQARGYGLFDHRDSTIIVACVPEQRIEAMKVRVDALEAEAREVRDRRISAEVFQEGED